MGLTLALSGVLVANPAMRSELAAVDVGPPLVPCPPGSEWQLRDLVNMFRLQHGAWELPLSAELMQKAQEWSDSMAAEGVLEHSQLADGVSSGYTAIAENVALDASVAAAEVSFEQSPVHRANLLGAFTEMGLGVSRDEHGRVWVAQVFAQRSVPTPPYRGPADSSAYRPSAPVVVFESGSALPASSVSTFGVAGVDGVPVGATAALVTVEAIGATDHGMVQLLTPGVASGSTVTLQVNDDAESTTTIAALDPDGRLAVYNSVVSRLRITVVGAFVAAGGATRGGRFVPVDAARLETLALATGDTVRVPVLGRSGVPRSGVLAVALHVTATGDALVKVAGSTAGGLVIAPVDAAGSLVVHSDGVVHSDTASLVTIDVDGWFTDDTAEATTAGLFVPVEPRRFLDTRATDQAVPGGRTVYVSGRLGLPVCPSAVAATVAVIAEVNGTVVRVGPFRQFTPGSVPILVAPTALVPAATTSLVATGTGYELGVHTSQPALLTVDVAGWFL